MFHQVEGFMVDRHITFGDLKGVLTLAMQRLFAEVFGRPRGSGTQPGTRPEE